jgi:hypothetical protein
MLALAGADRAGDGLPVPERRTAELVGAIRDGLPGSHEWTERAALLELAVRQAADIDALEADIECAMLRIGTDSERISGGWRKHGVSLDQQAVDLWETVQSALAA